MLYTNPTKLHSCRDSSVTIAQFRYLPGDLQRGLKTCIPTVKQGQSLTFSNQDASASAAFGFFGGGNPDYMKSIFHTVTTCQGPCGLDTGISYPLANGPGNLDSAQLGYGTPAAGRLTWSTPTSLKPGTYTYFCRIHPFMRGVFRIIGCHRVGDVSESAAGALVASAAGLGSASAGWVSAWLASSVSCAAATSSAIRSSIPRHSTSMSGAPS